MSEHSSSQTVLRDPGTNSVGAVLGNTLVVLVVAGFAFAFLRNWGFVVLGLALLGLMVFQRHRVLAMFGWRAPQIEIAQQPYALGATPIVVYRRSPRRVADISDCTVHAHLVCEERVTYERGTTTHTDEEVVFRSRSQAEGYGTADGLVADLQLDISAFHGAPTFDLGNNEVRWHLEVGVTGHGLPRDKHTFVIDVGPALDPGFRPRVQDS